MCGFVLAFIWNSDFHHAFRLSVFSTRVEIMLRTQENEHIQGRWMEWEEEPKTAVIAREQRNLLLLGLCDRD